MFGSTGANYCPVGWGTALRTSLGLRLDMIQNPNTGINHFAVSGIQADGFLAGGGSRSTWLAALASPADVVIIMIGANDLSNGSTAAVTITRILALWDEALAAGKQLIGIEILGVRSDHPGAATFPAKQVTTNAALKAAAAARNIQWIEAARVLDLDSDGFSDGKFLADTVHPNILGSITVGDYIASQISSRCAATSFFTIPAAASPLWQTLNPYGAGTVGNNQTATNWSVTTAGTGVAVVKNLISRTDGIPGNWQELVISGMLDAEIQISNPTAFVQVYAPNFAFTATSGDKFVSVTEFQQIDPFWLTHASCYFNGEKAGDWSPNGSLGSSTVAKPAARSGLLLTPPFVWTAGATALAMTKIFGNGTIRIGRTGIVKVP